MGYRCDTMKPTHLFKKGDSACLTPGCQTLIYATRKSCYRCGAPKQHSIEKKGFRTCPFASLCDSVTSVGSGSEISWSGSRLSFASEMSEEESYLQAFDADLFAAL